MPAVIQVKYGTVTFTTETTSWEESVPKRLNPSNLAKTHGTRLAEDPPYDARTVSIHVVFIDTTADAARTDFDTVVNNFPSGINKLYKHDDRYLNAIFTGVSGETFAEGANGAAIEATLNFYCPDPFYYGSETTSTVQADGVRATVTKNAAAAAADLTFTAKETGPRGNNIRVKMTSGGAESITTSTTELNATKTFGAAAADADVTITAVGTGVDGERIRVKFVNSTTGEEKVEVKAKDIQVTYNDGTSGTASTANAIKTLIDASKAASTLVTVAVEGSGVGSWAAGDAQGFTQLARGQNRDINITYNATVSTANSLKTAVEANTTANGWVGVTVEGAGTGVWVAGDASDYANLANGAAETISLTNSAGLQPVFPKFTFTPLQGGIADIAVSLSNAAADTAAVTWTFTFSSYTSLPNNGKIVIDFPPGTNLASVGAGDITSATINGTFTVAVSAETLTITRAADGTATAAGAIGIVVADVTNPKAAAGAIGLELQTNGGVVLDQFSTSNRFVVTGARTYITDMSLSLSSSTAAAAAVTYTLSFDLGAALAATDIIKIKFPTGTVISAIGAGEVTSSQIDGTLTPTTSGNILTITRSGGTSVASGTDVTIAIADITNPPSGEYNVQVWTTNSGGTITSGIDALPSKYAIGDARSVTSLSVLPVKNFPGRTFDYQGTITPNQKLVANFANFTVENNGSADLNNWKQDNGTASDVLWLEQNPSTFDLTWVGLARFVEVIARYLTRWI